MLVATTSHRALLEPPAGADATDPADAAYSRTICVRHAGHGTTWVGPLPPLRQTYAHLLEDAAVAAMLTSGSGASSGVGSTERLAAARERRLRRHASEFAASTSAAGLGGTAETREATERRLWLRLAEDAVVNPLSALWKVSNSTVLERIEGQHLARETVAEIAALALALAARGQSSAAPSREELYSFLTSTVAQAAGAYSSMHQDVARGRLTEIECLNGWVVAQATALGLPCVHNEYLARSVKDLTSHAYADPLGGSFGIG